MKLHRLVALGITSASALAAIALACTNLPAIPLNVCGNALVEPEAGEQCDTFGVDAFACFGPDAGTRACQIQCGDGGACLQGYTCASDGVCRKPSGTFGAPHTITADVRSLLLGDFDGDGRQDVVARGAGVAKVHFLAADGTLEDSALIDLSRGYTMTGDVTFDGHSSLVVFDSTASATTLAVSGTGVEVWRGLDDRTLSPVLFSSFPIPAVNDARTIPAKVLTQSNHVGADDLLVYAETPPSLGVIAYLGGNGDFNPIDFFQRSGSVVNDLPVGRVPPTATCDSIVIGYPNDTQARVYKTCTASGNPNFSKGDGGAAVPPTFVALPAPIVGALFLVDANGDGILDVVTSAPNDGVQAAFGDSTGAFPTNQLFSSLALHGPLLAVGDIDGDKIVDGVDKDGLVLSTTGKHVPGSGGLTYAQMRDINNDGLLDAVAIGPSGLDVYVGTGSPSPNHRFYDIQGAKHATLGDVDGDSNLDVLVSAGDSPSSLYVLFGATAGYPSDPLPIGSVGSTLHLSAGKLTWFFGDPSDSIASFIVMSLDAKQQVVVVPIRGHADRQLTSTYVLTPGSTLAERSNPLHGALARLPQIDASTNVIPQLSMVAAPSVDDGGLDAIALSVWNQQITGGTTVFDTAGLNSPFKDAGPAPLVIPTSAVAAAGTGLVAVDVDPSANDGDELVIVIPSDGTTPGTIKLTKDVANTWVERGNQPFTGAVRSLLGSIVPVHAFAADFDGDGLKDVMLVHGTGGSDPHAIGVSVLFNDGQGNLGAPVSIDVGKAQGAAPIHALPNGLVQIATVGPDGLTISSAAGTKSFTRVSTSGQGFDGVIDVVAGDVNGDGVDDLVVGEANVEAGTAGFQVLLGVVGQ